jgi:hypothetical protein
VLWGTSQYELSVRPATIAFSWIISFMYPSQTRIG